MGRKHSAFSCRRPTSTRCNTILAGTGGDVARQSHLLYTPVNRGRRVPSWEPTMRYAPHKSLGSRPPAPEVCIPALAAWPFAIRSGGHADAAASATSDRAGPLGLYGRTSHPALSRQPVGASAAAIRRERVFETAEYGTGSRYRIRYVRHC